MNWQELLEELVINDKLTEAIESVENGLDYSISFHHALELRKLEEGKTEGIVYDFKSVMMYAVTFEGKTVSVGQHFLLDSLKSRRLKLELEYKSNDPFTFFDFQFVLYLVFSADVSSGQTWYRNSIREIIESLEYGKANLNGYEISTEGELIAWLKNTLYGFHSLTDEEVKETYS